MVLADPAVKTDKIYNPDVKGLAFPMATYVGLALQMGFIGVVLAAISSRLQRPTQVVAAA